MNERVQQFLEQRKKQLEDERTERRNRHLINLGLYEGSDDVVWSKEWDGSPGWKYDKEKDCYYKGTDPSQKKAIAVTDEEYAEICKLAPEDHDCKVEVKIDKSAEKTLLIIANILLVVGIIVSIIIIIVASAVKTPLIALGAVVYFLLALATWAILRCFADMSLSLKEIKKNLTNRQ